MGSGLPSLWQSLLRACVRRKKVYNVACQDETTIDAGGTPFNLTAGVFGGRKRGQFGLNFLKWFILV